MVDCRSFQRLQLPIELVPPSYIIIGVCVQLQSSRFGIRGIIRWQSILWWRIYVLSKRYTDNNETMVYVDAWWVICSRGVGGSIGVGWVLLRQPERCQHKCEFCAIKVDKSVVKLLNVWALSSNISMIFAIYNGLDTCWTGSGVQLGSLRCLVIV